MEVDDSDQEDGDEPVMGLGLPELDSTQRESAWRRITLIMETCSRLVDKSSRSKGPIKGPQMPQPDQLAQYHATAQMNGNITDESDEFEGPLPLGTKPRRDDPSIPRELVAAEAEQRKRQLDAAREGRDASDIMVSEGGREEWMINPGKFDLLSAVKATQKHVSRKFEGRSTGDASISQERIDPKVKQEMDAIMQAHADSRGPSLAEQHREKVKEAKAKKGSAKKWKWNRDEDLDAGRRVDKDHLSMLLGGATTDLQKKFHGSYSGR